MLVTFFCLSSLLPPRNVLCTFQSILPALCLFSSICLLRFLHKMFFVNFSSPSINFSALFIVLFHLISLLFPLQIVLYIFQFFVRCFLPFVFSVPSIKFSLYLPCLYLLSYLPLSLQNVLNIIQSVFPAPCLLFSFSCLFCFLHKMFFASSCQFIQLFVCYLLLLVFSASSTKCSPYLAVILPAFCLLSSSICLLCLLHKIFFVSSNKYFQLFVCSLLLLIFSACSTNCSLYLPVSSSSSLFIVFSVFSPQIVICIFQFFLYFLPSFVFSISSTNYSLHLSVNSSNSCSLSFLFLLHKLFSASPSHFFHLFVCSFPSINCSRHLPFLSFH